MFFMFHDSETRMQIFSPLSCLTETAIKVVKMCITNEYEKILNTKFNRDPFNIFIKYFLL